MYVLLQINDDCPAIDITNTFKYVPLVLLQCLCTLTMLVENENAIPMFV